MASHGTARYSQRLWITLWKTATPRGVRIPSLEYKESFVEELIHFFRCITGREQPRTTAEDALSDLELCFKIVEAGEEANGGSKQ